MHAGLTHRRGCIKACACVIWTHTHTRLYCVGISSVTHVILVCLSSPPRPTLVVRGSVAKRRQVKLKLCITSIELFSPRPLRLDQTDTEFVYELCPFVTREWALNTSKSECSPMFLFYFYFFTTSKIGVGWMGSGCRSVFQVMIEKTTEREYKVCARMSPVIGTEGRLETIWYKEKPRTNNVCEREKPCWEKRVLYVHHVSFPSGVSVFLLELLLMWHSQILGQYKLKNHKEQFNWTHELQNCIVCRLPPNASTFLEIELFTKKYDKHYNCCWREIVVE